MKISYQRQMNHNYLIMEPGSTSWNNYEYRMLAANSVRGILHFQVSQIDEEIRFYYEITSKQPLSRLLESKAVRADQIRLLVWGIARVMEKMEQYLLSESRVLLEPDYIYVEPESYGVWLCLVPGLEQNFPEAFGRLLEYLLGKVDHQDKESVVLAYGLYQETQKENYGMQDLLRLLGSERTQKKEKDEIEQKDNWNDQTGITRQEPMERREEKRNFLRCLTDWWHKRKCGYGNPQITQAVWDEMFGDQAEREIQSEDSAPAEHLPHGNDTVLLADFTFDSPVVLRRLCPLDKGAEDIVIAYYPFVIGKQENLVDYVLLHDTVSRLHLRIDRENNRYFLQDLNSTNGTTVGGYLLENNESVELHEGDEVCIAKYRYRFT